MRIICYLTLALLAGQAVAAQDIIYKRDGHQLHVQIVGKIKGDTVHYLDPLVLHTPVMSIQKSEIFKIQRHSGRIDSMKDDNTVLVTSVTQLYHRGLFLGVCGNGQNLNFSSNYAPDKLSPKWVSGGIGIDVAYDWKTGNNSVTIGAGIQFTNDGEQGIYSDVPVKTVVIPVNVGFKILSRRFFFIHPELGVIHISANSDDPSNDDINLFIPTATCELGFQLKKFFVSAGYNQLVNLNKSNANVTGFFLTLRAGINLF